MADNWLENRERQLREGSVVYRKQGLSLDTLLHRVAEDAAASQRAPQEIPAVDCVKAAQLEAIARSAKILFPDIDLLCDEPSGTIRLEASSLTEEQLGRVLLAMQLKASELGFRACPKKNIVTVARR